MEYHQYDVEFLEAFIESQEDKVNGILRFVVDMGIKNELLNYLGAWAKKDNEKMCMDYIWELEDKMNEIEGDLDEDLDY